MGYSTGILAGRNSRKWKCCLMQWEPSTERQDPGWSLCLPGEKGKPHEGQQAGSAGSTRKGPARFLRAVVSVGKDLGL